MNMREDELWKDLLRKLKHPLTPEAEQQKQKAERSFIEQKLNKVFGGTPTGGTAPLDYSQI